MIRASLSGCRTRYPGREMNSTSAEFCDTNILLYAADRQGGSKQTTARALTGRLWSTGTGAISVQVLQEFFTNLVRKLGQPHGVARTRVIRYLGWYVVQPAPGDVVTAIDLSQRWQVSFWDAMILAAARKAGATVLWTEDLNHGQVYDGVLVRNPFLP